MYGEEVLLAGLIAAGSSITLIIQAGKNIPRTSVAGYYDRAQTISNPQVGDLVFFSGTYKSGPSHMGIYVGNNQFLHAGSSTGVTITSLDNPYWSSHFDSFKRFY